MEGSDERWIPHAPQGNEGYCRCGKYFWLGMLLDDHVRSANEIVEYELSKPRTGPLEDQVGGDNNQADNRTAERDVVSPVEASSRETLASGVLARPGPAGHRLHLIPSLYPWCSRCVSGNQQGPENQGTRTEVVLGPWRVRLSPTDRLVLEYRKANGYGGYYDDGESYDRVEVSRCFTERDHNHWCVGQGFTVQSGNEVPRLHEGLWARTHYAGAVRCDAAVAEGQQPSDPSQQDQRQDDADSSLPEVQRRQDRDLEAWESEGGLLSRDEGPDIRGGSS